MTDLERQLLDAIEDINAEWSVWAGGEASAEDILEEIKKRVDAAYDDAERAGAFKR